MGDDPKARQLKAALFPEEKTGTFSMFDLDCEKLLRKGGLEKKSTRKLTEMYDDLCSMTNRMYEGSHLLSLIGEVNSEATNNGLPADIDRLEDVLNAFTNSVIAAIDSDIGMIEQRLKYSLWISAFATGGLVTIVFRADAIISSFPIGSLIAAFALFCSVLISAKIWRGFNGYFNRAHMQQTHFRMQKDIVLCTGVGANIPIKEFGFRLKVVGFLPSHDRLMHRVADQLMGRISGSRWLDYQQWLVLLGFSIIVEISFLRFFW